LQKRQRRGVTSVSEVKQDNRFKRYFKETRAEVRKVHWPTRKEARSLTTVVLAITVAMTIFLGLIISPIASWLAGSIFVQQNTLVIVIAAIATVIGIIALAVVLRRQ
jgi:preprotein translocase SecE subunit